MNRSMHVEAPQVHRKSRSPNPWNRSNEEIEAALLSGARMDGLEELFGPLALEELRMLAAEAAGRSDRRGEKVLILPGIMGSTLGYEHDTIWFDPFDVARGNLARLTLPPPPGKAAYRPLGVMLFAYLKLKLRLLLAGFRAEFFPYDWRAPIHESARELAKKVEEENGAHLVAHSMGGLVARAALKNPNLPVRRFVMLGTPNRGSLAAVQALRGTYALVRSIALIEPNHDPTHLANKIFSTFPGLHELLPWRKSTGVEFLDPASWPAGVDRSSMLAAASGLPDRLAGPGKDWFLIAGVKRETVVDASLEESEIVYRTSFAGDGTVPLASAKLEGVPTFFVEESHGSLANNRRVCNAVIDLLRRGETKALEAATRGIPSGGRRIPEATLNQSISGRRLDDLSPTERRKLISEWIAPDENATPTVNHVVSTGSLTTPVRSEPLRVHIDRVLERTLDVRLVRGSITDVDADAYALGLFPDIRPAGAASDLDRHLGGAVSTFAERRMLTGARGSVFMMPVRGARLRANVLVFVGLGPYDSFGAEEQQLAAEQVIRSCLSVRIHDLATVLLGSGTGPGPDESLRNLFIGFTRGLRDADAKGRFRSLTFCEVDPGRFQGIKEEMLRIGTSGLVDGFRLRIEEEVAPPPEPGLRSQAPSSSPIYLRSRVDGTTAHFSLLGAEGKAAVIVDEREFNRDSIRKMFDELQGAKSLDEVADVGARIANDVLPPSIRDALAQLSNHHLVVVHDSKSSIVPWEAIAIGAEPPSVSAGISRRYETKGVSVARWLEQRRKAERFELLLVSNPTGDLEGAEEERARIRDLFAGFQNASVTELRGKAATREAIERALRSGQFDAMHYAGHAYFDPANPRASGLRCADGTVLGSAELERIAELPTLVFLNACESGRIRRSGSKGANRIEENIGVAEALLRGGIANFVATNWPVGDQAASTFASAFYRQILDGHPIGPAMASARKELNSNQQVDWANYIHYGSSDFRVKI